ncbi:ATP synthase F1 subunit gamma [Anaeromusa sp.]|jgi:F-type H+-transporting ATPase subunit gamma|uniref:ATP synthase F1 subunit gamma n=1 Tax=Anaeromusa sp. TaxID=1872520 RepID=UPI002637F080|nr:ATP synthase F1 subunit gamma [Anaeromusa sp.]MDD3157234.1 ATP synthase F1 subunit gamma [Anaeromusa sp.]MEA4836511.1 ATP synthase F1 subunit gamma [Anaeromusa sp.]
MASTQDIRRRIKSVRSIEQITKAMKMVAAARLRKAQERAYASQPFTEKILEVLGTVANSRLDVTHPLLAKREIKKTAYLILSADKGLAGAYSSNLMKEALAAMEGKPKEEIAIIAVGRKAKEYFSRRSYQIEREYLGFSERPTYEHATRIAAEVSADFTAGLYDEVYLVYTYFRSPINQHPTHLKLLPAQAPQAAEEAARDFIFEPSAESVLTVLLPRYLETVIYGGLMQAAASELGSRMTAMGSATDNAEELIHKLVLNYNKVRQATITREISEIVGGAEALK